MSKTWLPFSISMILIFGCTKSKAPDDNALTEPPNPLLDLVGTYYGEAHHHDAVSKSTGGGVYYTSHTDTTYYSLHLDVTGANDGSLLFYLPFLSHDTFNLKTNFLLNAQDTTFWRSPYGKSSHSEFFHLYFRNDSLLGDILYEKGPLPHYGSYNLKFQKN